MTLLVLCPDFISHYGPLAVTARAASQDGHRVVVATGPGLRAQVERDGFEWRELRLGAGSNGGVAARNSSIDCFIAATAMGPIETIQYQARNRATDLLWRPDEVASAVASLCDEVQPDQTIVDHVSFVSTLAMIATGRSFVTLVPGHPSQLPVGTERYGQPHAWPAAFAGDAARAPMLDRLLDNIETSFTEQFNASLAQRVPNHAPVPSAYRATGHRVLFNSNSSLIDDTRRSLLPDDCHFIGPLVRREALAPSLSQWTVRSIGRPQVFVALGTFLSHRGDVLVKLADGLRSLHVRAAIATGATDPARIGPVPADWIVDRSLPQVAMLANADLIIHHGGNNSVQESLAAGVRQIVLPFSTDQFANAADLERTGLATVLSPNCVSSAAIAEVVAVVLAGPRPVATRPLSTAELSDLIFAPRIHR